MAVPTNIRGKKKSEKCIRLSLKAGEKIYINGAVLKTDKKISLELLNDATFLLESHVLQPEMTTTPLRQLYYAAQLMLIEPQLAEQARQTFTTMLRSTLTVVSDLEISSALKQVDELVINGRIFEALKLIRSLFAREAQILDGSLDTASNSHKAQTEEVSLWR